MIKYKGMKKFICAAVAAACIISSVALCGCSSEASVDYTLSEDGTYAVLSGVSGDKYGLKEYEVPANCVKEEDGGLRPATAEDSGAELVPVKEIGDSAFFMCSFLRKITIPEGITEIGDLAFAYCGFTEFTIPSTVKSIGMSAFGACDALKEITIPQSVTEIGERAFYVCDSLERVIIEANVEVINSYAFANNVIVSGGQVYISSVMDEVYLPASVKRIDVSAFYGSPYLADVHFAGTEEQWSEVVLYKCVKNEESGEVEEVALNEDERGFYVNSDATQKLNVKIHYQSAYTPET